MILSLVRISICTFYLVTCVQSVHTEEPIGLEFTEDDINSIVGLHNSLRRQVASGRENRGSPGPQPEAIYIPDLIWDDRLANAAWQWAQKCQINHDPNLEDMQMGQNIATTFSSLKSTIPNWADAAIYRWYSEVDNMNCRHVTSFTNAKAPNGGTIGHYTQMLWAETTAVGCSAIGYTDYSTPVTPYRIIYVCNYSPPGNIVGRPIYDIDLSSSNCPLLVREQRNQSAGQTRFFRTFKYNSI